MDIKDLSNFTLVVFFVCPGLIFLFMSRLLATGQPPAVSKDNIAGIIALSVIYAAFALALGLFPKLAVASAVDLAGIKSPRRLWLFVYAIGLPFMAGTLWGALVRAEVPFRLARRLGLRPYHSQPTAQGTAFSRLSGGEYLVVTLKDGAVVEGWFVEGASLSRDASFRDLYLGRIRPPAGQPADLVRGAWIAPGEIRTIEVVSRKTQP